MHRVRPGSIRLPLIMGPLVIALLAIGIWLLMRDRPAPVQPAVVPTTQPTTAPATQPTSEPAAATQPARTYMDVVRAAYPDFPTTQPLGIPLHIREGARLIISDPVYLDPIGHLWITRADADPLPAVLKRSTKEQIHILPERVVFVHRWPDERGTWWPQVVVARTDGGFELVSLAGRQDMGARHAYDWARAFSWNDVFVVPTRGGVSIFRPDRRPMEVHHQFVDLGEVDADDVSPTQLLLDWRGLLAWMPWENGKHASPGAARFSDDNWTKLDASAGWPEKLLHLVPLLDGGVLQLVVNDDHSVGLSLALLDPAEVDEPHIRSLVQNLSNIDPNIRKEAFDELTRYGRGVWPLLEKLLPEQFGEARVRVEQLLLAKIEPTLGGMKLLPGDVRIVTRSRSGAAILCADAGVEILHPDQTDELVAPAWLAILPGRSIQLMPQDMVRDLHPARSKIDIIAGEFIVHDPARGPRWWLANHFSEPLLRKSELQFTHILGQDARGRWLFRNDANPPQTLIIDPTLPDPHPRLPVWRFPVSAGVAGWTSDDWPAVKSGGAWVLGETDWRPLDEKVEQIITEIDIPDDPDAIIFADTDGTRYFDGRETLRVIRPDGSEITWPLPDEAVGTGDVWLVRGGEDRLFLFNEPGRIMRLKPTPESPEPFELEAIFSRRIPSTDHIERIWLDPAGRIIIAHEGNMLSILFPTGRIPPELARKIPASELRDEEEE